MKTLTPKEEEALAITVSCDRFQIPGPRLDNDVMETLLERPDVVRCTPCPWLGRCHSSEPGHQHYFPGPLAETALKCAAAMRGES